MNPKNEFNWIGGSGAIWVDIGVFMLKDSVVPHGIDAKFLEKLQEAHDTASSVNEKINPDFMEKFEENMFVIAIKHGLSYLKP